MLPTIYSISITKTSTRNIDVISYQKKVRSGPDSTTAPPLTSLLLNIAAVIFLLQLHLATYGRQESAIPIEVRLIHIDCPDPRIRA